MRSLLQDISKGQLIFFDCQVKRILKVYLILMELELHKSSLLKNFSLNKINLKVLSELEKKFIN